MLTRINGIRCGVRSSLCLGCLALVLVTTVAGARRGPMKTLSYDPSAREIGLFDGIDQGALHVRMIHRDASQAELFLENKTDQPLTVKFPEAVAGVHVLRQFGAPGFGLGQGLGQGNAGQGNQPGQGSAQMTGGGQNGNQNPTQGLQQGPGQGPGPGFFSIPAERVVRLPIQTVCLEHGKPDPRPSLTYQVVPLQSRVSDPVLRELLKTFGSTKVDQRAAQAAAWHLTDKLSWQELTAKQVHSIGRNSSPYFDSAQLQAAQKLVETAQKTVQNRPSEQTTR